ICAVRKQFDLTQQGAALLFGGGTNAFSKYERGDVIQSVAMDRLLRLTSRLPFTLPMLAQFAGVDFPTECVTANYDALTPVCINDPQYRSRTVVGRQVVVAISEWRTRAA